MNGTILQPVVGAARYFAVGNEVWMRETSGHESVIETRGTNEAAVKCAERWQKKENKAVAKSRR